MKDYSIRPDCRLCGSTYTEVLDLGETALANEVWEDASVPQASYPLCLVACDSCGHRQLRDVVNPELMFSKYTYVAGGSDSYRAHLQAYAKSLYQFLHDGALLVEIGGNDGTLGRAFDYSVGIQYLNIDPCDVPQTRGMRMTEFFSSEVARRVRADFGHAQVIVANHVLAHVDQLADVAEGIRALLAPDGTFVCEVGDGEAQLKRRDGIQFLYLEHCDMHDAHSFAAFWARHGLSVVKVERNGAQGASMRLTIRHQAFSAIQLKPAAWDNDALRADADRMRVSGSRLRHMSERGVHIVGYGAPARMTTLTHVMGLDADCVKTVFDDNPRKHGKFTPGKHIPIMPAEELDLSTAELCFNFCHGFPEIRERRRAFGGLWADAS